MDNDFHRVHATHLTNKEIVGIAKTGTHVVLCPSTEGNLGTGIFPLKSFQNLGGKWSIETDNHIDLSPLEEIRILDYGQRLTSHQRDRLIKSDNGDSGYLGFDMALKAGRSAMGNLSEAYFKEGDSFDALIIDSSRPLITEKSLSTLLYMLVIRPFYLEQSPKENGV